MIWTQQSRADLRHIFEFIAHDSPRYAARVIQDIADKAGILTNLPRLGRVVPEIGEESVREISMYSYRILYEIKNTDTLILGVIHKRRHFQPDTLPRK